MDPFAEAVMKEFKPMKHRTCSSLKPLTSIDQDFDADVAKLLIHEERISQFFNESTQSGFSCCYHKVEDSSNSLVYSNCIQFKTNHQLMPDEEFLLVKCSASENSTTKLIYVNGHSIVRMKENVRQRIENSTEDKLSILLLGLDSVSRMQFIRSFPNLLDHLKKTGWFELKFYNKVGDNTLLNLFPLMTGISTREAKKIKDSGKSDVLPFLWEDFRDAGYATISAEDNMPYSTFHYLEGGFEEHPIDYNFHTYARLLETNLEKSECDDLNPISTYRAFLGFHYYVDYLYEYAFAFLRMFRSKPTFSFIWSGSFTHDNINLPSSMDDKMLDYLKKLEDFGTLGNTFVVFFSDHGMRYGKHILKLVGGTEKNYIEWKVTCPSCQSIFEEIPINRKCADAGIPDGWCACKDFEEVKLNSEITKKLANIIIEHLNNGLASYPNCANLTLDFVRSSYKSELEVSSEKLTDFLISFDANPSKAVLQATVRCENGSNCDHYKIIGGVSRLNAYHGQSDCIADAHQRKYCYCI
ncbi:CLUMA_CG010430, isoform A [Clunio marinus]|uniref:CLUMA_CG010430, isoform A n=1 Tax=Clunio marinus TaxID=568069 RepID=A0A1J1I9R4_9DIPT|nr:CLUMA_CG010430, isoform A [Clunio marinus]